LSRLTDILEENRLDKSKTIAKETDNVDDWSLEDGSEVETAAPKASLKQTIEVNLFKNHMQELSVKVKDNINIILGNGEGDAQVKACEYLVCFICLFVLFVCLFFFLLCLIVRSFVCSFSYFYCLLFIFIYLFIYLFIYFVSLCYFLLFA
jgi:hypothetical protein